jgi:HD-GYP domain-containing protein (c-di-GMP phosphodiesterase class II)
MKKSELTKLREELEHLYQERDYLTALLDIFYELVSELNIEVLSTKITKQTKKILSADRCSLYFIDKEKDELYTKVADGMDEEIRISSDQGIAGAVFKKGILLNVADAYQDSRFNPLIDQKSKYKTKSLLTVPLFDKANEIIAVLQVLNKKEGVFTKKDQEIVTTIAKFSSLCIEKAHLYMQQDKSLTSFIETLASALDTRDYITAGHSRRVTLYALEMGRQMKLNKKELEILQYAGLLHDIGKIGVPEVILFKDRKLSEDEYEMLKRHAILTKHLLSKIYFQDQFNHLSLIASSHHEKINGQGYPDGLIGDDIPLGGKILAVADVFDALTSRRPYKDRMELEDVIKTIDDETGASFEPFVVYNFKMIPLDRLTVILEHGYGNEIRKEDLISLRNYNLRDIVEIRSKPNKSVTEVKVENIFMRYYLRKYRKA